MTTSLISSAFAVLSFLLSCSLSCWDICCLILLVLLYHLLEYLEELLAFYSAQVLSISSQIKIKLKPQGEKKKKKEIKCASLAEGLFSLPALNAGALQALCLTFGVLLITSWSITSWVSASEEHPASPPVPCFLLAPGNAHCWDDFPLLALKSPFLLLSFFQWNSTTSFSCKTLCGLSHLACPLSSLWEYTADETPASCQLLPKFQTFTRSCLFLLFRIVFQQINFSKSLLILNHSTFFIMPTEKLTMVKQEIQWNIKLVFPLCLPVFSSLPFHTGWLACFILWRLVRLDGNHCFFFQSYFLSNVEGL